VANPDNIAEAIARKEISRAQAIVIWTDALTAEQIAARVRALNPSAPLYICRKAAEGFSGVAMQPHCATCGSQGGNSWIASAPESLQARTSFSQRYHQRFGVEPGTAAAEAYDAVRIITASFRQSGPNRARLRDALAALSAFPGASGIISFDHAGNDTSQVTLLKLK
jgi:branched-chain amino acid transport system substrate-binding protein